MDKVKEHAAMHYCMVSLNSGEGDLDDEFEIEHIAGSHMDYVTTIEEYLIDQLTPFTSAASQNAEIEWKEAWETAGEDSGYAAYVPTSAEKFNWQDVATMAIHIGVGEQILLEFLVNVAAGAVSDWTLEWEDETDEHCRTFLIVNPE